MNTDLRLAALPPELQAKYDRLRELLRGLEGAVVAFSGVLASPSTRDIR